MASRSPSLYNGKQAPEASIVLVNQVIVLRGYENCHNRVAEAKVLVRKIK